MKTSSIIAASVLTLTLVACSSSTEGTATTSSSSASSSSSAAVVGDAICAKLHECNSKIDLQTCGAQFDSPTLGRIRSDYRQRIADCYSASDCSSLSDGGAGRLNACLDESIVYITPSEAVSTFCSSFVAAAGRCDVTLSYGNCLNDFKAYGDEHVAKLQSCTEKSCKTMADCITAETK